MCESCDPLSIAAPEPRSRREFLTLPAAILGAGAPRPVGTLGGLDAHPRSAWASGLPPAGPMEAEAPGDLLFLIVHHSATSNDYAPAQVRDLIRGFHRFHTSAEKGWPDVAYNFFVDRFGAVWEGREGSLDRAVVPDATDGHVGFALACCFIGDHREISPTAEARRAMVALLAALADRYDIDTSPGATVNFTSRGSNRWPAGAPVTTATISGHRDVSHTVCPGDAGYRLVREDLPPSVTAARTPTETPQVEPEPTPAPSPVEDPPPPEAIPDEPGRWVWTILSPSLVVLGAVAGAIALIIRRRRALAAQDDRGESADVDEG